MRKERLNPRFGLSQAWHGIFHPAKGGYLDVIPVLVLTSSFVLFLLLGHAGVAYFHGWRHPLCASLGIMFLVTASAHWGSRRSDWIAMVPPVIPMPALLVTVAGILEVAGAVALQIPRLTSSAAAGLFLLLVAFFPANVYAARHRLTIGGRTVPSLLPRAFIQIVFLIALWFAAQPI